MYFYVFLSEKDGQFYTGYTHNVKRRFSDHKIGLVASTKYRRPLRLIYFEACVSQNDALRREKYLKYGNGKIYLRNRLKHYFDPTGLSSTMRWYWACPIGFLVLKGQEGRSASLRYWVGKRLCQWSIRSETLNIFDIDGERKLIRVANAKGGKDRYTLLSDKLLIDLRLYFFNTDLRYIYLMGQKAGSIQVPVFWM